MEIKEEELTELWNMVFNLSLGMLHNPEEAEDATQEIFAKAFRSIRDFRGESKLSTWVYQIAKNHLIDEKKKKQKKPVSFELFEADVNNFEPYKGELGLTREEETHYVEEVKIGCTTAMLLCLDPFSRFVYILGNIFRFSGKDAATVCETSEANFRQILSRSGQKISNFMKKNCGLINPQAQCKCKDRLKIAIDRKRINPEKLLYKTKNQKIKDCHREMNQIDEIAKTYRDNPYYDRKNLIPDEIFKIFKILTEE